MSYPEQSLQKNDRKAGWLIGIFSFVVFAIVASLSRIQLRVDLGFDVHIFAAANAVINSIVAVLLITALVLVKKGKYIAHKKVMMFAMVLSILFLVSYITHHLLSGDTLYGDSNHDGVVDDAERALVAGTRGVYLIILLTHIFLAAIILPFILYTAYRGMITEYPKHKKLGRITWPIWFYVSLTGPILYVMISPYYQ
jgi:putative membrane protein